MSTSPLKPTSNAQKSDEPLEDLRFDYPDADIILRSRDAHHFRVPKSCIVTTSPVLDKLIQKALDLPADAQGAASLPVVELPESGEILHNLLTATFVFPGNVTPSVPSSIKKSMELLSVAQRYQMASTLDHIRAGIMRQKPPSTKRASLYMYFLAQQYGLRREALLAAQDILKYPMNIQDMVGLVQGPGASLYELWKYYETFRAILKLDLAKFKTSGARNAWTTSQCVEPSSLRIPRWLDEYVESIGNAPNLFDVFEFNIALVRHISGSRNQGCICGFISNWTIRDFWEALASVIHSSFKKAESGLSLVPEHSQAQVKKTVSLLIPLDLPLPDANILIRSSDLVNFRVHKSVLAVVSPFFKDLVSLPQPSDTKSVDGLPVVQFPEGAELLNSLVSMLYPVPPVVPSSYEKVLYLLAACQKYDMVQVQSAIRAEVNRGTFPGPEKNEAFRAYAIASNNGLIPEMENAARLTLDHPMTFEAIGEGLRLFKGSALRELARFRVACGNNFFSCYRSFREVDAPGPSSIWVGCPSATRPERNEADLPTWLDQVFRSHSLSMLSRFAHPLPEPSSIRDQYLTAIQAHGDCAFCLGVLAGKGSSFGAQLESRLKQARDEVRDESWSNSGFN